MNKSTNLRNILLFAFAALLATGLASCNKELELKGTTWEGTTQHYFVEEDNMYKGDTLGSYSETIKLEFTSESTGIFTDNYIEQDQSYVDKYDFSYTTQGKGGSISVIDENGEALNLMFSVKDDEMQLSYFEEIFTLKKQK